MRYLRLLPVVVGPVLLLIFLVRERLMRVVVLEQITVVVPGMLVLAAAARAVLRGLQTQAVGVEEMPLEAQAS
jgi:hypothetical protein